MPSTWSEISVVLFYIVYGIMMCGHTTPEVEARWGDYGDMAKVLLHEPNSNEVWTKFNVCDGQFPTDDDFASFQARIAAYGDRKCLINCILGKCNPTRFPK